MQPTTVASWAAVIWRHWRHAHCAAFRFSSAPGFDTNQLHDAGARIPVPAMTRLVGFWQSKRAAIRVSG